MTPDPKYLAKLKTGVGMEHRGMRRVMMGKSVVQAEVTRMMKMAPMRRLMEPVNASARPPEQASDASVSASDMARNVLDDVRASERASLAL